jgi:hypothetical protein
VAFLLLQFVVRPLAARRLRRKMEALGMGDSPAPPLITPAMRPPAGLDDLLARVQEAVQRREAEGGVGNVSEPESGGDIGARLAQLKALRDQGLITAEDYEAKKAEILSGL